MKQRNRFIFDMLDQDIPSAENEIIYRAGKPTEVVSSHGSSTISIPYLPQERQAAFFQPARDGEPKDVEMLVRSYGDAVIRLTSNYRGQIPSDENNPMFLWDPSIKQSPIHSEKTELGWIINDDRGITRMTITTKDKPLKIWSTLQPEPKETFDAVIFPDENTPVSFMAHDEFFPSQVESFSLGYIERDKKPNRCVFSLHSDINEKFAGTGERFNRMNLAGNTFLLENTDGLGVNSRRAYKNVPFYISSKGYGLLIMTSSHVRLSLADISTRAVQGLIEDDLLDLFFIGGGSVEQIVKNYRKITGFPQNVPLWSYGTWMSRMSYFSADETREVVRKMREKKFPCDVIHIDTGWFKTDWKCEWEFNDTTFPDPEEYFREMEKLGIKVTLWQLPSIAKGTKYHDFAREKRFIPPKGNLLVKESNFSNVEFDGSIDFTNPDAVTWYQNLLERLLMRGAAAIKTDFGEMIEEDVNYFGLPYSKLHNLYSLLYQKAAFEVTEKVKGPGQSLIWARSGWTGCQRYPLHWGGDSVCSWDGMAGTLRGGLHLGLSGFAFWSHDVPGFHGTPSFMNSRPENDLYVRWTQFGVFTSHLRYHGTTPREPYEYPEVEDIVRKWLNLRYALIPYFVEQGKKATESGFPILRALIFHHSDDPLCWTIDDEFYCGESLLVAPVMNSSGIRDVYLPEGTWTDFWTGEVNTGGIWIKNVFSQLERIPVYVKSGAEIPFYPEIVLYLFKRRET
jgi:alpha-D-xyloside xylohydrolase